MCVIAGFGATVHERQQMVTVYHLMFFKTYIVELNLLLVLDF